MSAVGDKIGIDVKNAVETAVASRQSASQSKNQPNPLALGPSASDHASDEMIAKLTAELMPKKGKELLKSIQKYRKEYQGNDSVILFLEKIEEEQATETRKVLDKELDELAKFTRQNPKESRELHLLNLYLTVKKFEEEYQGLSIVTLFHADLRAVLSLATAEAAEKEDDKEEVEGASAEVVDFPQPNPKPKTEIEKVDKMILKDLAKQFEEAKKLYSQYGLKISVLKDYIVYRHYCCGISDDNMYIYGWLALAVGEQRRDIVEMLVTFPKALMRVIINSMEFGWEFDKLAEAVYVGQKPTFNLNKIIPYTVPSLQEHTEIVKKQITLLSQACSLYRPGTGIAILNFLLEHCPKVDLNFNFIPLLKEGAGIKVVEAGKAKNYLYFIVEKLVETINYQIGTVDSKTYRETIAVSANTISEEACGLVRILVSEGFRDPNFCAGLEKNCDTAFSSLMHHIILFFNRNNATGRTAPHPALYELITFTKFLVDIFNQPLPKLKESSQTLTKPIKPQIRKLPEKNFNLLAAALNENGDISPPQCAFLLETCISSALREFRIIIADKPGFEHAGVADDFAVPVAKASTSTGDLHTEDNSNLSQTTELGLLRQKWQNILYAYTWMDHQFSLHLSIPYVWQVTNLLSNRFEGNPENDQGFNPILDELTEEYLWGVHKFVRPDQKFRKIKLDKSKDVHLTDQIIALISEYICQEWPKAGKQTIHPRYLRDRVLQSLHEITDIYRFYIPCEHRLKRAVLIGFNLNACSSNNFPPDILKIILSFFNNEANDVQVTLLDVCKRGSAIALSYLNVRQAAAQLRTAIEMAANENQIDGTTASPLLFDYAKKVVNANASLKQDKDKDKDDTAFDRATAASKALNSRVVSGASAASSTAITTTISSASDMSPAEPNYLARPRPILNFMEILQDRAKLMEGINDYLVACDPLEQIVFSRRFSLANGQ